MHWPPSSIGNTTPSGHLPRREHLLGLQLRQSVARGPLQVWQRLLHLWQTCFSSA